MAVILHWFWDGGDGGGDVQIESEKFQVYGLFMKVPMVVIRQLSKTAQRGFEAKQAEMERDTDGDNGCSPDDVDNVSAKRTPLSLCGSSAPPRRRFAVARVTSPTPHVHTCTDAHTHAVGSSLVPASAYSPTTLPSVCTHTVSRTSALTRAHSLLQASLVAPSPLRRCRVVASTGPLWSFQRWRSESSPAIASGRLCSGAASPSRSCSRWCVAPAVAARSLHSRTSLRAPSHRVD
jgi:hypothetical protein